MPIDLGDQITRSVKLTTAAGVPVDADSTPTYAVTLPTLAAGTSPVMQHGTTGEYYVIYPTTLPGLHRDTFTAVVGGVTTVIRDVFNVEDPAQPPMFGVDEALGHLRGSGIIVRPDDLETLRWYCQIATQMVERDLNRCFALRTVTETRTAKRCTIALRKQPAVAVTGVLVDGVARDPATFDLDDLGFLSALGGWGSGLWNGGRLTITYTAGTTGAVPAEPRKVGLNGIQRMWQASQQLPHPAMDDTADIFTPNGVLTPLELEAYTKLRMLAIA